MKIMSVLCASRLLFLYSAVCKSCEYQVILKSDELKIFLDVELQCCASS